MEDKIEDVGLISKIWQLIHYLQNTKVTAKISTAIDTKIFIRKKICDFRTSENIMFVKAIALEIW
ncbi:MAG: hypothetical protein ACRC06_12275 [Waterburya sp.]